MLNKDDDKLEVVTDNEDSNYDEENSCDNKVSSLYLTQGIHSDTSCPKIKSMPEPTFSNYWLIQLNYENSYKIFFFTIYLLDNCKDQIGGSSGKYFTDPFDHGFR